MNIVAILYVMANAYMVSIFIFILVGHLVSAGFYADDNMCSDENATCTSEVNCAI